MLIKTEFGSCVFESPVLGRVVAIPAPRGEACGVGANQA
jgi:hypothetical protein